MDFFRIDINEKKQFKLESIAPRERFELSRRKAPVAFEATAFPG